MMDEDLDLSEDLEELRADYTKPKPKRARKPKPTPPEPGVEYYDDLTPDTLDQVQVKMYRRRGSQGWWWRVGIPTLKTSWSGTKYWGLYEDSGYAITKWGAQYEIKKCIKRHVVRKEDTVEWTVPIAMANESKRKGARR